MAVATGQLSRAGSWWSLVAKCWKLGMNEAPELGVPQPPLSQETLLRKSLERGADHPEVAQRARDRADSRPDS